MSRQRTKEGNVPLPFSGNRAENRSQNLGKALGEVLGSKTSLRSYMLNSRKDVKTIFLRDVEELTFLKILFLGR